MLLRTGWRMLLTLAVISGMALAQGDMLELDLLWRRGQFEIARELIAANRQAGNNSLQFLVSAASCSAEMRDWDVAAELYAALADSVRGDHAAYSDAHRREWHCRWQAAPDRAAAWVADAQAEIASRLDATKLRASPERQLALELEYALDMLLNDSSLPPVELRIDYPDSELTLLAAKAAVDILGTEADDNLRLELIDGFLANFPGNYWCHLAWRHKLYTAWRLRSDTLLVETAEQYLAEYPNQPQSRGAVGRYYFEADVEMEAGFIHAQRSVELYETALGIDGAPAALGRVQDATRDMPASPDHNPANTRGLFLEYLGSRFSLARYYQVRGDNSEAMQLCAPVIALDPFTTEEDHTLAPFHFICGLAEEDRENYAEAYWHYLMTMVEGDSRNRFALQASERLPAVTDRLRPSQIKEVLAAAVPLDLQQLGVPLPAFSDVTIELGLPAVSGKHLAWGDVDLDGDPDLLVDGCVLYRNDSPGSEGNQRRFRDASKTWGLSGKGNSGVFADIDNDGDLDFYRAGSGKHGDKLMRNDFVNRAGAPAMRFSDITLVAGDPADDDPSQGAAWLDGDNDGYLDLYVGNYEIPYSQTGAYGVGTPDRYYRNNAGTYFERLAPDTSGLLPPFSEDRACRGGIAVADFDGDGDQDVFTGNYRLAENYLWRNDGVGVFHNNARLTGTAGSSTDGWWGHTIGSAWGDVDNDGDLDLFVANLAHPRYAFASDKSQLLINDQGLLGTMFSDQRAAWGIRYEETHAGPVFFDCNNDGHLDLFITSIYTGRRSFLYLNDGQGHFHDVTYLAGARVFDGWGAAWADYDGDGDLDLAVGTGSGLRLLRNDSPAASWLIVHAVGEPAIGVPPEDGPPYSNATGIGTRVTLVTETGQQLREVQSGTSTGCGNELVAHFGLGFGTTKPLELIVRFPSGRTVTRHLSDVNQVVIVGETEALPTAESSKASDEQPVADVASEADDSKATDSNDTLTRPSDSRGG
jgi:hypothetical protein